MAPAAKKSKTVAAPPPGAVGSLQRLFGAKGGSGVTPAAAPAAAQSEISTPTRSESAAPLSTPSASPASTPGLNTDQLQRIEENRRRALELQAKKRAREEE